MIGAVETRPSMHGADGLRPQGADWARTCARYFVRVVTPELVRRFGSAAGIRVTLEEDDHGHPTVTHLAVERRGGPPSAPRLAGLKARQARVARELAASRSRVRAESTRRAPFPWDDYNPWLNVL